MRKSNKSIHPIDCRCNRCRSPRPMAPLLTQSKAVRSLHPIALAALFSLGLWAAIALCIWGAWQ